MKLNLNFLLNATIVLCLSSSSLLAMMEGDERMEPFSPHFSPSVGVKKYDTTHDLIDLFEGNNNYGTYQKGLAKTALEKIEDNQSRQLAIKFSKTAFPDNSGFRAEILQHLIGISAQKLEQLSISLEKNKTDYYKLRWFPRMNKYENLLGGREESATATSLSFREVSPSETRFLLQKEFSTASFQDEKSVLATFGVGPCVAIGVYNSLSKKVGLAHCDGCTSQEEAKFIWQVCEQTKKEEVKVYLLSQSQDNISRFHSQLKKMGFSDKVFTLINTESSTDVGIDSKDGSFFIYKYDGIKRNDAALNKRLDATALNYMKSTLDFIK